MENTIRFCTMCQMPIEGERLELLPDTHICIECARRMSAKSDEKVFKMVVDGMPDYCLHE